MKDMQMKLPIKKQESRDSLHLETLEFEDEVDIQIKDEYSSEMSINRSSRSNSAQKRPQKQS